EEPLRVAATRLPLDKIEDPDIAHVLKLWNERRGGHAMPPRGALKPEELAKVLGRVNLLDVLRDPLRFVFRVRGSSIAAMHDHDMTGRDLSEMQPPEYRDMLIRHYTEAVGLAAPLLYSIRQSRGRHEAPYRRIILPLGTPAGLVEMLLTVSAWKADYPSQTALLGFKRR
ncbi:MAG: PAS domain-containing protein, partial [Rhodospirillales bacterium]